MTHRIDAFQTTPVINFIHKDDLALNRYQEWLVVHLVHPVTPRERAVQRAKRVLGKQHYCWQGLRRNWIWEGSFQVTQAGAEITRHWRLFASVRGFSLEIEYERNDAEPLTLGRAGLNAFLETWDKAQFEALSRS